MPPLVFTPEQLQRGWDNPLHIGVQLKFSTNDGASLELFFPRPYHWTPKHKSLDTYDYSSIPNFLRWLRPGDKVNMFHQELNSALSCVKLHDIGESSKMHLWDVSWKLAVQEREYLSCELYDNAFPTSLSLWACYIGELVTENSVSFRLLSESEFLALPSPRPNVLSISLKNFEGLDSMSEHDNDSASSEVSEIEDGESEEADESEQSDSEQSDFDFPTNAATQDVFSGRVKTGTLFGHADDRRGDWDVYVRFDAAISQDGIVDLCRGDLVASPATSKAVLTRILGGQKVGGKRASMSEQN